MSWQAGRFVSAFMAGRDWNHVKLGRMPPAGEGGPSARSRFHASGATPQGVPANFHEALDRVRAEFLRGSRLGANRRASRGGGWRSQAREVLDCHSDPDHNRSVVTFAGEPEAVAEAALAAVAKATELIDLNPHRGEHPRIGATDVLPFVPLQGVTMDECVALARRVGAEIWKRYQIPVYFYENAATRPARAKLENVRRGQFEALREASAERPRSRS